MESQTTPLPVHWRLEGFHVAAEVVLLFVGAALVGPFQDDIFASVFGEGVGYAVGVDAFEVGRENAGREGEGGEGGQSENDGEKTAVGHSASSCCLWIFCDWGGAVCKAAE